MEKSPVDYAACYDLVMKAMTSRGLLLGSYDPAGKPNIMTIGWGAIGSIWGLPVWIVLVRPSRYSFACLEHTQSFSVNVPTEAMRDACAVCGTRSGRDTDKFALTGLEAQKGLNVLAPTVAQCPIVYECHVVHSSDVLPAKLTDEIRGAYMNQDYHRIYYGKILSSRASSDAAELLAT
jgi:flavin reductase (DIM6/NTAB) family NADH-FMN oxidoreductase RutF